MQAQVDARFAKDEYSILRDDLRKLKGVLDNLRPEDLADKIRIVSHPRRRGGGSIAYTDMWAEINLNEVYPIGISSLAVDSRGNPSTERPGIICGNILRTAPGDTRTEEERRAFVKEAFLSDVTEILHRAYAHGQRKLAQMRGIDSDYKNRASIFSRMMSRSRKAEPALDRHAEVSL